MSEPVFTSGRYLLWDKPLSHPYFDIIHRDTDPGRVFDLNLDLENYNGSIYIKVQDIVEMARTIGMLTVPEVERLKEENAELRRQINLLPAAQEELKDGLDDLTAKFLASINNVDRILDNSQRVESQDNRKPAEAEPAPVGPFDL